ncbi:O-antigen ligase family protein [Rubrivirga sp.]|uniref:O-antigen ligase family protein n=1 Tax=Rubrivirga sp. TaxID=1885344 RepID=UPI003C762A90
MTPGDTANRERFLLTAAAAIAGVLAIGIVLLMAAGGSPAVWAIAVLVGGGLGLALWQPSPLARLTGVLLLQLVQLGGEEGTSALEAVAGLALVAYIGHWYVVAVLSGRPLVRNLFDAAAVTYGTVGFVVAIGLGLFFGPNPYDFRADIIATIPFLLYLPVKELCAKDDRAGTAIGVVLCTFGLFAALQNAVLFRSAVSSAEALYKVADARFNIGETSITAGLMIALASAALSRRRWFALGSIAVAGILIAGLVITKSRGFWISALFGIVAMAVVAPGRGRRRIIGYGTLGAVAVVGLAIAVLGDQLTVVALGALDRLVSIGTATQDISLINRFAESDAVWDKIKANPILGYGWGVQFSYYSVVADGTRDWAFLHNGYLSLWYKTGLWGLILVMTVWIGAMARAAKAARLLTLRLRDRALALAAGATMAAFTPVAISSNPFLILDQVMIVTVVMALAHGMADRAAVARPDRASAP